MRLSRRVIAPVVTILLVAVALVAGRAVWLQFTVAPWTRDGQVQGYVVNVAPEVSGRITRVAVADNQPVRRGDVLYEIEPVDFQIALAAAQAAVQSRQADMAAKQQQAARRTELSTLSTSVEEKQTFQANADMARLAYASAEAQLSQARIDLDRTKVVSPVNGYVTNLQVRAGDYATKGGRNISVVDADSFWIAGFFEETKIAGIRLGDPALVALMSFREPVRGHVESIARGINTPNTSPGSLGLASVDPVFTWVRLAQRIPVRIHIDAVPAGVELALGMTATVSVGPAASPDSAHGLISRLLTQVER